jgi:dihydroflavonol-4-reductase
MQFLVTGASGFIGGHVARLLVRDGHRVRALVRPTANRIAIRDLPLELVVGDLASAGALEAAMRGVDGVFHVAGVYSFDRRDRRLLHDVNVEGTRRVLAAARAAGVVRVVHTSTAATRSPQAVSASVYAATKLEGEQLALQAAAAGQQVVVVNPTGAIGAGDHKPTPTGKLLVDYLNGKLPGYVEGGFDAVNADDVARGHWLAFSHGQSGRSYVLSGERVEVKDLLDRLAALTGLPPVTRRIPYPVAIAAATVVETACGLVRRPAPLSTEYVRASRVSPQVSAAESREIGYEPAGIARGLRDAVEWYAGNGYAIGR